MRASRRLLVALVLAVVVVTITATALPTATSLPSGITRPTLTEQGCSCHNGEPVDSVSVALTGLPVNFTAGQTYNLTVTLTGGPPPGGQNQGGFNLKVSDGSLAKVDDTVKVTAAGDEATHTAAGNDQRSWSLQWTAPADDSKMVSFTLFGNAVNGDGSNVPTGLDEWNRATLGVKGLAYGGAPPVEGGPLSPAALVGLMVLGLFVVGTVVVVNRLVKKEQVSFDVNQVLLLVRRYATTTNHKEVGILYMLGASLFGIIALLLSLLVRLQLIAPNMSLLKADFFNQVVTMHGAVMVLFFVSPLSFGFANYIVPLQIGAKDMAFPRLNAFGFWAFLFGGLVAASGFVFGGAADTGWTFYSPLTSTTYSPGLGVSLAGVGLVLLVFSVTASTVNFIVTILNHRTPKMGLWQMPMFTWSILLTVVLMLVIFPALLGALLMLVGDRHLGMLFFTPENKGSLLWAHLFWFFGHPEVYVVLFPELGIIAEILPVFARRPLYGKRFILYAMMVATVMSCIVWVHHMFITGISPLLREIMTITTELISIPFGVIILSLLATLHKGRIRFATANLFALGAAAVFILGGVTGVFLSSSALDYNLRGTYYVVAHFHLTLGSVVLGVVAGIYYWYPKLTGRLLDERLGKFHFWGSLAGFMLTFMPLFLIPDMPRRIYTYSNEGWALNNLLSSLGALLVAFSQMVFIYNLVSSFSKGPKAPADPWQGETLEWALSSPPPQHNFEGPPPLPWARDSKERG